MINKEVSLITSFGKEYITGNSQLNKGDNVDGKLGSTLNNAINQESNLFGLGLDLAIAKNTNLYFRRRWFSQEDKSFVKDNIKGTETTIELKLYF
jgi:predicted transcriptional regulator with HTH domain